MRPARMSAALLAGAIAFGAGYAVRLACAWAGGTVRVVETETVDPTQIPSTSVSTPTLVPAAPQSPAVASSAPAPDAATDADAPTAAADEIRKALYEAFARHDWTAEFRRMFDKVAVAPLGRTPSDLGLLGGDAPAPLVESGADVRRRTSAVNAAAGKRRTGDFQFVAFRRGDAFEVVLGDAGLPFVFDPRTTARQIVAGARKAMPGTARAGGRPELAPEQADAVMQCCEEAHRATESARRALWSRLHGLAASGETKALDPRDVVGVCVAGGRCVVVRVGDDPELERLLDEADRDERAVRAEVEATFRR